MDLRNNKSFYISYIMCAIHTEYIYIHYATNKYILLRIRDIKFKKWSKCNDNIYLINDIILMSELIGIFD